MLVIAKGLSFLGVVLLLGAGIMSSFLLAKLDAATFKRLQLGKWLGAMLIVLGGSLEILGLYLYLPETLAVRQKWAYIRSSQLDLLLLIRCLWVGVVLWLIGLSVLKRWRQRLWLLSSGLAILLSFSLSANAQNLISLVLNFIHLSCGVSWAGAVVYTALLPLWSYSEKRQELYRIMKCVSVIGLASIGLMSLTGLYAAFTHMDTAETLISSQYGRVLIFKVVLVLNTLALAFANRMIVLPILKSRGTSQKLAQFVQVEAVLLIIILFATGLLTSSPLVVPIDHVLPGH